MTDKNPDGYKTIPPEFRVGYDWGKMQHELDEWGHKLEELRAQSNELGEDVILDLERRYGEICSQAVVLKQRAEDQAIEARERAKPMSETVSEKAQEAKDALKRQSEEISAQASVAGEKLSEAAGDVSEGFGRAWEELKAAFSAAYDKMKK